MEESKHIAQENSTAADIFQQRQQIQEILRGYRQAQVLLTCVELGVFEVLCNSPISASEVAKSTGTSARGMELLLNAATGLGLLNKDDCLFSNSPLAEACLVAGKPGSLSQSISLESAFYRRWGFLADAVRTGYRPEENRQDERPDDWVRNFIYALYYMARPVAPIIAEALALPEEKPMRVIDVGGGHGGYSIALAQRYPRLHATVFELPRVVPVAREIIHQAGLSNRATVQEGDFQKEKLGSGYDIALVFGVLNGESPEGRFTLIQKVFEALNPGGQIVIRDRVLDADRTKPVDVTFFALQMLLATDAGGVDTHEDWDRWLQIAGFHPSRIISLPDWVGSSITIAEKPVTC